VRLDRNYRSPAPILRAAAEVLTAGARRTSSRQNDPGPGPSG
jgi:superfamily I DNA/RNA helicase